MGSQPTVLSLSSVTACRLEGWAVKLSPVLAWVMFAFMYESKVSQVELIVLLSTFPGAPHMGALDTD